ncbi:MAG TPA: CHAT domain-containing protein [Nitrospirales bacterium]|jgi:CHAT domain-containing protein/outer membrane protein assembly factor BamD (BamD/ComL family)
MLIGKLSAVASSLLLLLSSAMVPLGPDFATAATGGSDIPVLEEPLNKAAQAYQRGDFEQAAASWQEAARAYQQAGQFREYVGVLIDLAQAEQALGHYNAALQTLRLAQDQVSQSGDRARLAEVLGSAGTLYLAMGDADNASQYLNKGLEVARETNNQHLAALILNNMGNLHLAQKNYPEAVEAYTESLALSQAMNNRPEMARAQLNTATALLRAGRNEDAKNALDRAVMTITALPDSHDKAFALITAGLAYQALGPRFPDLADQLILQSWRALNAAAAVADKIENPRAASYAWGYMGALYESEKRYDDALELTGRAVVAGQRAMAIEALYRWHWQTGRLLKARNESENAISAYRKAVAALESVRPELGPSSNTESFREGAGKLYFEFADLLLRRAASSTAEQEKPFLTEARDVIEKFKGAELRDYFRDDCIDAARSRSMDVERVSQNTAVLYPILLPDRTELLVSVRGNLNRFTVPVSEATMTQEIRTFRKRLMKRTTRQYLPHAQQLYDWLIRPIEPLLKSLPIDTLVVIPDGPLRTVPMAALHDGEQFLIARYAVATTPGLRLTDSRPLRRGNPKALSAGLSKAVQNFSPLPDVVAELENVQRLYPGRLLLNSDFLLSRLEEELKDNVFTIVHIASHGQFESDARKSFLLTFDDKLTMDKLETFVGRLRFREDPLALLTLSACETAAGDDRAALGLAGVAIKAGASSALATLWFINDEASSALVSEFYRQLRASSASKAVALQRAQLKLMEDPVYEHPIYWSPFLLLSNWL